MLVPSFLIQVMSYQKTHRKRQNNSLIAKRIDDLENGSKVMRQDFFTTLCINVFQRKLMR